MSDMDIRALRHSKRWKERYDQYLRKKVLPEGIVQHRLKLWIVDFESARDST